MRLYPNPVINSDFPDPDIIRVGDTYLHGKHDHVFYARRGYSPLL